MNHSSVIDELLTFSDRNITMSEAERNGQREGYIVFSCQIGRTHMELPVVFMEKVVVATDAMIERFDLSWGTILKRKYCCQVLQQRRTQAKHHYLIIIYIHYLN